MFRWRFTYGYDVHSTRPIWIPGMFCNMSIMNWDLLNAFSVDPVWYADHRKNGNAGPILDHYGQSNGSLRSLNTLSLDEENPQNHQLTKWMDSEDIMVFGNANQGISILVFGSQPKFGSVFGQGIWSYARLIFSWKFNWSPNHCIVILSYFTTMISYRSRFF